MFPINRQYSQQVAFAQDGREIDERLASLLDALVKYEMPDPLKVTGLKFSMQDGQLNAMVLGHTFVGVPGHCTRDEMLVGRISFSQLHDCRIVPRDEALLSVPLFSVALDSLGNAGAAFYGRPFAWTESLNSDQGKSDFCRAVCIALIGVAVDMLADFDA